MDGRWTLFDFRFLCFILLIRIRGSCGLLNPEGLALLEFRAGVEYDPYQAFASWNPDDDCPCHWLGVLCVDGNVHMLNLNGLSIHGTLAPELGKLTHLKVLVLSENHFSGIIPNELGDLTTLELLDLSNNEFSGTIPAVLAGIPSLKQLLLFDNNFEGSVPEELEKFNALVELDENFTSGGSGAACANRKFGLCIWQSSLQQLQKAEPAGCPIKEFVQFFFSSFQPFGASASPVPQDNCCGFSASDSHSQPQIQAIESEVSFLRRRLIQDSSDRNLAAAPAPNGTPPDNEAGAPTMRSSGAFPAVPRQSTKQPAAPVPSPPSGVSVADSPPTTPAQSSTDQGSGSFDSVWKYVLIASGAAILFIIAIVMICMCRSRAVATIGPWTTGLSGQLQKAFVTGVPKLNRRELETACEDFSNIINDHEGCTVYKGTLSSGVEIAVISASVASAIDWTKRSETIFRKKVDTLSRVNHKNFVNLIGYCEEEEPFTRMMVFEYAPNGSLSEHLHVKEVEHLDWTARMRIIMGTAYCLQYMHDLVPPVAVTRFRSEDVLLTDDYAAKIADTSFWASFVPRTKSSDDEADNTSLPPVADLETNVYSFGVMLLEVISGQLPKSKDGATIVDWASEYLKTRENISAMVDPTLNSFKQNELETLCDVIHDCLEQDPRKRPNMTEVIAKLRKAIPITPDAATPRLSPLWWAELEILSVEAS
uniref:Protein kinase domain-containing protein n=1 Tax=Kalanchoe fedtschenkoi TaxID=63787 RepID=A0A7N0ZZ53_KALFE